MASNERGFSLIEAVTAVSLVAVGVSALAQVALMSGRTSASARQADIVQQAAREKMEQLRALAWTSDAGVPVSDLSTDLSTTPASPSGGVGLSISPNDTLQSNVAGYCDFLDAAGRWLAGGANPPVGTAWIRRWSILPLNELADTLVLQVVVEPPPFPSGASPVARARDLNGAWLVDIRTRSAR